MARGGRITCVYTRNRIFYYQQESKKVARKIEVEMKIQTEKSFVEFENGQGRFEM